MKKKHRQYILRCIAALALVVWIISFGMLYVPWQRHTLFIIFYADPGYADYLKLLFVTLCGILFIGAIHKIIIRMIILKD